VVHGPECQCHGRLDPKTGEIRSSSRSRCRSRPTASTSTPRLPVVVLFGHHKTRPSTRARWQLRNTRAESASRPRRLALASDDIVYYADFPRLPGPARPVDRAGQGMAVRRADRSRNPTASPSQRVHLLQRSQRPKPNTIVRFRPATEKFQPGRFQAAANRTEHGCHARRTCRDGNSLVDQVGIVEFEVTIVPKAGPNPAANFAGLLCKQAATTKHQTGASAAPPAHTPKPIELDRAVVQFTTLLPIAHATTSVFFPSCVSVVVPGRGSRAVPFATSLNLARPTRFELGDLCRDDSRHPRRVICWCACETEQFRRATPDACCGASTVSAQVTSSNLVGRARFQRCSEWYRARAAAPEPPRNTRREENRTVCRMAIGSA